jgi:hypothetical protein
MTATVIIVRANAYGGIAVAFKVSGEEHPEVRSYNKANSHEGQGDFFSEIAHRDRGGIHLELEYRLFVLESLLEGVEEEAV